MGNLTHTVSSDIASFRSAARVPIESLKCHFLPIQEGTGDPSPDNVRPISGWQGVEVFQDSIYLPQEYQRIEYLENSGTQYIITNYKPMSLNAKVEWKYMITTSQGNTVMFGCSTGSTASDYMYQAELYNNVAWYNMCGSKKYSGVLNNPVRGSILNTIYSASMDQNILTIDGYSVGATGTQSLSELCPTMCLYGYHSNLYNEIKFINPGLRFYSICFYEDNQTVANYIPCRRKSDNKPGMYDTVSQTFFTNQGTGEFTCGPDVGVTIPITFPSTGKNLLNKNNYGFKAYDTLVFGGTNQKTDGSFILEAGTYTLSTSIIMNYLIIEHENKSVNMDTNVNVITFTCQSKEAVRILILLSEESKDHDMLQYDYQLELGDTATAYEPFNNTVYGGYIDIVKGELVKEWEQVRLNDSTKWQQLNRMFVYGGIYDRKIETDAMQSMMGNIINSCAGEYNEDVDIYAKWNSTTDGHPIIQYKSTVINPPTLENIQQLSANGDIEICYKLATPIIYKIPPIQLTTLLNQNYIWSNTNDVTEVSYAIHDSADILMAKKRIISHAPHLITLNDTRHIQFNVNMISPIKEAKIFFTPQQIGSEEPSTINIRNIQTPSYINIDHTKDNLFDLNKVNIKNGYIRDDSGNEKTSSNYYYTTTMYPAEYPQTIYIGNMICGAWRVYFLDSNGSLLGKSSFYSLLSKTMPGIGIDTIPNCKYFQLQILNDTDISELWVSAGHQINIFSNTLENMYGGYIDLTNGTLVQTYDSFTTNWGNYNSGQTTTLGNTERRVFTAPVIFKSINELFYDDNSHFCNVASNFGGNLEWNTDKVQYMVGNNLCILKLPVNTDDNLLIQFVCQLKDPIIHQLSIETLQLFFGKNHLFTQNGSSTITYWIH